MTDSLQQLRTVIDEHDVRVVVCDLDGVLRHFDPHLWTVLDIAAGVPAGSAFDAILRHPYLDEVVRGRGTHARWRRRAALALVDAGAPLEAADVAVTTWASTPAQVDEQVLAELWHHRGQGRAVFVLTNGTDRVPQELSHLGLDDLLGHERRYLLNTADLGAAKPEPEAFDRALARMSQVLGEDLSPAQLVLLDDTERHVRGARELGWHGITHRSD